ncbi:uncharacterized protein LOC116592613 [Mustela erminea]|uniref:uncharacterized protein LOC116592613 n=1 Tax=Mustela erminea TaxID=36723 RepID=UPI001386BA1D|nr:uncharacterized protein LOC116592613 [Mustela erminea]
MATETAGRARCLGTTRGGQAWPARSLWTWAVWPVGPTSPDSFPQRPATPGPRVYYRTRRCAGGPRRTIRSPTSFCPSKERRSGWSNSWIWSVLAKSVLGPDDRTGKRRENRARGACGLESEGGGESGSRGGWAGERAAGQGTGRVRGGRVTRRHSREAGRRQRQALAAPGGPGPDLDGSWGWGMRGAPSSVARKQRGSWSQSCQVTVCRRRLAGCGEWREPTAPSTLRAETQGCGLWLSCSLPFRTGHGTLVTEVMDCQADREIPSWMLNWAHCRPRCVRVQFAETPLSPERCRSREGGRPDGGPRGVGACRRQVLARWGRQRPGGHFSAGKSSERHAFTVRGVSVRQEDEQPGALR